MSKMKLLIGITICCFTLRVESQQSFRINPSRSQGPTINPDQLYFADNMPYAINGIQNLPSKDLQPPYEEQGIPGQNEVQNQSTLPESSQFKDQMNAITNFSINIMKKVSESQSGNTVVSPYSVATILSLLQQGATGVALQQITDALQMSPALSAATYKATTEDIQSRQTRNILKSANNLFVTEAFSLNDRFRLIANRDFKSEVTPTKFDRPVQAAEIINDWVSSKTDKKIDKLLAPDSLSDNTQLVLVNAIYFKGIWDTKFRPEATKPDIFYLGKGNTKTAQFMRARRYFKTGVDSYSNSKVILLPFEREEYSLMIILPSELISVDEALSSLTVSQLAEYQKITPKDTQLILPKFTVRADTDLVPVLNKMGIKQIFGINSELSNIGTYSTFAPQVTSAVHSAVLTIDEEGGSAAGATAFSVVALSYDEPSVIMKINRPFIAVIWDNKLQLPLFIAKVVDPVS